MSKIRSQLTIAHQASGLTLTASQLRTAADSFFEADIITITGAGTLALGDVVTPRAVTFKLISGDDVQIGWPYEATSIYYLRLSGAEDFTMLRLDVESYVEISDVTCIADTAGALQGTYFEMADKDGPVRVWFDLTATGADPAGGRSIYVVIADEDAAAAVQTKLVNAINADSAFTAAKTTGTIVRITNVHTGARTEIDDTGATGMTVARVQEGATMPLPVFTTDGTSELLVCVASV